MILWEDQELHLIFRTKVKPEGWAVARTDPSRLCCVLAEYSDPFKDEVHPKRQDTKRHYEYNQRRNRRRKVIPKRRDSRVDSSYEGRSTHIIQGLLLQF